MGWAGREAKGLAWWEEEEEGVWGEGKALVLVVGKALGQVGVGVVGGRHHTLQASTSRHKRAGHFHGIAVHKGNSCVTHLLSHEMHLARLLQAAMCWQQLQLWLLTWQSAWFHKEQVASMQMYPLKGSKTACMCFWFW